MALRLDLKIAEEGGDWELQYIEITGRNRRKQEFVLRTGLSRGDTERHAARFDKNSEEALGDLYNILDKLVTDPMISQEVIEFFRSVLRYRRNGIYIGVAEGEESIARALRGYEEAL